MHEHMVDKLFARFDPAKTGSISLDAFLKPVDARFDKIETKKQGFIDRDELVAFFGTANPEKVDAMLKRLDLKHDGKITKDEFEQHARKRFALVDLYNDGKITKDEAMLAGPDLMLLVPHHKHGGPGEWQHRHEMNHAKPNAQ
jgi:Ca2+-binding EF-hand superfamily protein